MTFEELKKAMDNKTPILVERSWVFSTKPTVITEVKESVSFGAIVKVEGGKEYYEGYRIKIAENNTKNQITMAQKLNQGNVGKTNVAKKSKPSIESSSLHQEIKLLKKKNEQASCTADFYENKSKQSDKKLLLSTELAHLGTISVQVEVSHILFNNILNVINK